MTRGLGFQVPFGKRVRKDADIYTRAFDVRAGRGDPSERAGRSHRRRLQFTLNIVHPRVHDLGISIMRFGDRLDEFGWWLEKRISKALPHRVVSLRAATTRLGRRSLNSRGVCRSTARMIYRSRNRLNETVP
jgi:hypothetical protein